MIFDLKQQDNYKVLTIHCMERKEDILLNVNEFGCLITLCIEHLLNDAKLTDVHALVDWIFDKKQKNLLKNGRVISKGGESKNV